MKNCIYFAGISRGFDIIGFTEFCAECLNRAPISSSLMKFNKLQKNSYLDFGQLGTYLLCIKSSSFYPLLLKLCSSLVIIIHVFVCVFVFV